jgi:hypothetical protein
VRVDATAKGPFNPKAVILSGTPDSAPFNDKADVITHVAGAPVGPLPFQRWLPLVAADGP